VTILSSIQKVFAKKPVLRRNFYIFLINQALSGSSLPAKSFERDKGEERNIEAIAFQDGKTIHSDGIFKDQVEEARKDGINVLDAAKSEKAKHELDINVTFPLPDETIRYGHINTSKFDFNRKFTKSEGAYQKDLVKFHELASYIWIQSSAMTMSSVENDIHSLFSLSGKDAHKLIQASLEVEKITITGTSTGFSCPLGMSAEKNVLLSKKRAEDSLEHLKIRIAHNIHQKKYLEYHLNPPPGKEIIIDYAGIIPVGQGTIVNDPQVQAVVLELNSRGNSIDYAHLDKENEVAKFDHAMKELKTKDPKLFSSLMDMLEPLCNVKMELKVTVTGKILYEEVDEVTDLPKIIPVISPQKTKTRPSETSDSQPLKSTTKKKEKLKTRIEKKTSEKTTKKKR